MREGASIWEVCDASTPAWRPAPRSATVDIAIIGAGITGAFLAERFTRGGMSVAVLDKREPQQGSTAASTALVMWETDAPLIELEQRIGFETAAAIWRRCYDVICGMNELAPRVGAQFATRESVYLAGDLLDPVLLAHEGELRRRAGMPSAWETGETTFAREGVVGHAALRSSGAGVLDPVQFARALLKCAEKRGAFVYDGVAISQIDCRDSGACLGAPTGERVNARTLLLATGYEMPDFVQAAVHRIDCTWAIAAPLAQPPSALVWEASSAYAYMRSVGSSIVIGGEDERGLNADQRDALITTKARTLTDKLRGLLPRAQAPPNLAWSAFFGATTDSLPLIGPVPGVPHVFAAYGYGGNGITFSALAAELLFRRVAGAPDPLQAHFALDRR